MMSYVPPPQAPEPFERGMIPVMCSLSSFRIAGTTEAGVALDAALPAAAVTAQRAGSNHGRNDAAGVHFALAVSAVVRYERVSAGIDRSAPRPAQRRAGGRPSIAQRIAAAGRARRAREFSRCIDLEYRLHGAEIHFAGRVAAAHPGSTLLSESMAPRRPSISAARPHH